MILRIFAIVAVLAVILGVVALLAFQYVSGPLRKAAPQVCMSCVETHWNGRSTLRAGTVSGEYRFTDDATYLVRFQGGEVTLADQALAPGCYEGRASRGATVALSDARDLRLQAPAPEGGCEALDVRSGAA